MGFGRRTPTGTRCTYALLALCLLAVLGFFNVEEEKSPVHLKATVGDSVVFNCRLEFPNDVPIPYIMHWNKAVSGWARPGRAAGLAAGERGPGSTFRLQWAVVPQLKAWKRQRGYGGMSPAGRGGVRLAINCDNGIASAVRSIVPNGPAGPDATAQWLASAMCACNNSGSAFGPRRKELDLLCYSIGDTSSFFAGRE